MTLLCVFHHSLVTFNDVYISYVIPKAEYDSSDGSYYLSVTVCVMVPQPASFDLNVVTESVLNGGKTIQKVSLCSCSSARMIILAVEEISEQVRPLFHQTNCCFAEHLRGNNFKRLLGLLHLSQWPVIDLRHRGEVPLVAKWSQMGAFNSNIGSNDYYRHCKCKGKS